MKNKLVEQWALPIVLIILIVLMQLCSNQLSPVLEFDRNAIYQGEWWRLFTGHLMHANNWHLGMNVAALIVILIYSGLSGWLHCLIIWGACADIAKHWSSGWLILFGVFIKVIWEQIHGGSADIVALIGVNVAVDAHLFGAITGLIMFFIMQSVQPLAVPRGLKAA
jgi:membrane associated rhomboid family serine protease